MLVRQTGAGSGDGETKELSVGVSKARFVCVQRDVVRTASLKKFFETVAQVGEGVRITQPVVDVI